MRILIVEPHARSRADLQRQLEAVAGPECVTACAGYHLAIQQASAVAPDVAVVVLGDECEPGLDALREVSRRFPAVNLVAAGPDQDASTILRAVRAGAREYVPLPTTPVELADLVRRITPRAGPEPEDGARGPRLIAVTGATGGVGSSSVAVNLATTLASLSRRDTVLADFDLLLGSLEEGLGVVPDHSIEVVVRNLEDLDPALLKRWLPRHQSGLYMLPHPVSMEDAVRIEPESFRRVVDLLRETFTTVVIDTSKGLQASDFIAFEAADVILIVLQLTLNCTRNTVRLMQYLRQFEGMEAKVRLVVNRINSPLSEISLRKAEELLKTSVSWQVPNATRLFRPARTRGLPIDAVEGGTGSKAHGAIVRIAQELQPFPPEPVRPRRSLFRTFSRA